LSNDNIFLDQSKLAEILPTLPRGDAALFDELATVAGVAPIEKTAALTVAPLTRDTWVTLGALNS
jgi:hypothetical protein